MTRSLREGYMARTCLVDSVGSFWLNAKPITTTQVGLPG